MINIIKYRSQLNQQKFNRNIRSFIYSHNNMSKHIVLQRQFQALSHENQTLRNKAKKIHEIEAYVNILIHSTHSSQQQLTRSNLDNKQLKNKLNTTIAQTLKLQQTYQNQFQSLQSQFKKHLLKKDQEIALLSANKQKQCTLFEQKLIESQNRSRADLEKLKLQFLSVQKQHHQQITKLTSTLTQKTTDLHLLQQSKNQLKKAYLEESNNINAQISKLQRAYQNSQNQIFTLKQQLTKLTQLLNQLTNSQNLLKKQLAKKQNQLLAQTKTSNKQIAFLQQSLNQATNNSKKSLLKLKDLSHQNQKLHQEIHSLSQNNNQLELHNTKLQRLINQKDHQIQHFTLKIQQQSEQHKRTLKRHHQQLNRAEEELSLTSERFLCEKRNSDAMKGQIQDLLKVIDKLQTNLAQNQHCLQMVKKENSVLFKEVENITKEINYRIQQLNDLDQKYKQSRQKYLMFQEMYQKQAAKSQNLHKQNTQIISRLQAITSQQKYLQQQQISNLIQKHLAEKRDLLQSHRMEKQNLNKNFQQSLRQKDQQAKKRLELLEDEISLMRVRH